VRIWSVKLISAVTTSVAADFLWDDADDARPDAWCARCEEVRAAEGDWNERSEAWADPTVVCHQCYDAIRARNARPAADADVPDHFTCTQCGEVHDGLPRAFDVGPPAIDADDLARATMTHDTCEFDAHRLIRACLEIPMPGAPGPLVYGVWVSLAPQNYDLFRARLADTDRYLDGPWFGWLMSAIPGWDSTDTLKTRVHPRPPPLLPIVELEPTNHPLARAQREGITHDRFREVVMPFIHGKADTTG
jgi:hypothetical protein